ncbi:unnamed protein product [Tilletia caries]|uniref:ATPase AAA-type core domain-containing protein n=1 Tax=Tilletia caries TaxID=13290 RepID=A0ABN7IKI7_9BASI|nr:unnamed protein product [Tilletia caries]CAD7060486.1 unnamed protein product [Tilletia caries]
MTARSTAPRRIATLGMFIIDQFQFFDPDTAEDEGDHGLGDHIGGGGTYFTVGARVWLPPSDLSMVVDRGDDFPAAVQAALDAYDRSIPSSRPSVSSSMWKYRPRTDGHGTTRALNIYEGQQRGFKYLTPKLRLDPRDLLYDSGDGRHQLLLPTHIHFICSPERARLIIDEIEELLRDRTATNAGRPALIWEPIPDSALPENLDECIAVMKRIDVFSPNHDEAASFLGVEPASVNLPPQHDGTSNEANRIKDSARSAISELILKPFLQLSEDTSSPSSARLDQHVDPERQRAFGPAGPIVHIRSGALGSLVARHIAGSRWVDAYHTPQEAKAGAIKDVTGAGNACLGGFTAALSIYQHEIVSALADADVEGKHALDLLAQCAAHASVSASFVIEQQGLPGLSLAVDGKERWNGDEPSDRLHRLQQGSADTRFFLLFERVEKHPPTTLDKLVSHREITFTVERFIEKNRLPHRLFCGPPGTGKTSTVLAMARKLYGPQFRQMTLELNASDNRGIDVVQEQIKTFSSAGRSQTIIEQCTRNVRFCIICNYVNKIIPAIQSGPDVPDSASVPSRWTKPKSCSTTSQPEGMTALLKLTRCEMRRALGVLQACHAVCDEDGQDVSSMKIAKGKGMALVDLLAGIFEELDAVEISPEGRIYQAVRLLQRARLVPTLNNLMQFGDGRGFTILAPINQAFLRSSDRQTWLRLIGLQDEDLRDDGSYSLLDADRSSSDVNSGSNSNELLRQRLSYHILNYTIPYSNASAATLPFKPALHPTLHFPSRHLFDPEKPTDPNAARSRPTSPGASLPAGPRSRCSSWKLETRARFFVCPQQTSPTWTTQEQQEQSLAPLTQLSSSDQII